MNGTFAIIAALAALLAGAAGFGWHVWSELGDVQISRHGWIALGLGAAVTTLLGVGLMFLVYHSSRRGYDDEAGRD